MNNCRTTDYLLPPNSKYKIYEKIGSGAYGEVYKGTRDDDGLSVALKRVMITDEDGYNNIPLSTHRELNVLRRLNKLGNDNIVRLFDIVLNKIGERMCIDLVFELSEYDLETYLKVFNVGGDMPISKILNLGQQLMDGVNFMHSYRVLHRDLKPANILIDRNGTDLKITDFGLARILGFDAALTPIAVTLWYRSPEILFKNSYLTACDVWSAGCIIGEMVYGRPLFAAENEVKQLEKIVCRLGYEAVNNWPDDSVIDSTCFIDAIDPSRSLDRVLRRADVGLRGLIKSLLRFDPDQRMLSTEALVKLKELRKPPTISNGHGCTCHSSSTIDRLCSLPDCISESQDFMIVNSVVRNVLDDDFSDRNDLSAVLDCQPIQGYPYEEVEVIESSDISLDSSRSSFSQGDDNTEEDEKMSPTIATERDVDEVGDSFSSYRSQNNESFSSYAPSSHTGVESTDEDQCEGKDLHELEEFKEGFLISDDEDDELVRTISDSDTCQGNVPEIVSVAGGEVTEIVCAGEEDDLSEIEGHVIDLEDHVTGLEDHGSDKESHLKDQVYIGEGASETGHSDCSPRTLAETMGLVTMPSFLIREDHYEDHYDNPRCLRQDSSIRQGSYPLQEKNESVLANEPVCVTPGTKAAVTRKRIISVSDDDDCATSGIVTGDEDSENSCPPSSGVKIQMRPGLTRHKSLRRRLSVIGPHVECDRKTGIARCVSVMVPPMIGENEEIQNMSFGEHSLSQALDDSLAAPQSLSDRPKIIVRRRSQFHRHS